MQRHTTIVLVAVLAAALGGCDLIGEELAEQAVEQVTGAEIDVDDEGISVETDEGSFSANADGEMTMETEDGTFESQTGQVPDSFPVISVPLPDATVINGSSLDGEDGMAWMVNFQFDSGDPATVLQEQVAALEAAGFTSDGESDFSMGDGSGGMAGALLEGDDFRVNVSVLGEVDDFVLAFQVFEQPPEEDATDGGS